MKSIGELIQHMNDDKDGDVMGFRAGALLEFVPFERLKYLTILDQTQVAALKPEEHQSYPFTQEAVLERMRDYMTFAIEKAQNHRGISASRSVEKYKGWMWILDKEHVLKGVPYPNYGAPILRKVCLEFGFPWPVDDDINRMADGRKCSDHCDGGCGQ